LLAGRKLLLADDSITIQKVVDLTFTDEGAIVLCLSNGREATERLEDFLPDVVLADVFMPEMNGYELCEYIKKNDKLKHIPVMLLVGSFEPFDEEEARRVGANDTLTKPFQSIRRLIEKVGLLSSNRLPEEQIPTAELPKPDDSNEPPVEKLSTAELEMTTADTRPLPPELRHVVDEAAASQAKQEQAAAAADAQMKNESVESTLMESSSSQRPETSGEFLLDLGDFKQARAAFADDFVLDIDLDEVPEPSPAVGAFPSSSFRSRDSYSPSARQPNFAATNASIATISEAPATTDQLARTQEFERITDEPEEERAPETTFHTAEVITPAAEHLDTGSVAIEEYSAAPSSPAPDVSVQQLSPEMIDAIARRAVEQLSEKVIQEIAWEVVPQLAELLIKRQLEEKNS
jgi:CheY-like chemotaxis protein